MTWTSDKPTGGWSQNVTKAAVVKESSFAELDQQYIHINTVCMTVPVHQNSLGLALTRFLELAQDISSYKDEDSYTNLFSAGLQLTTFTVC